MIDDESDGDLSEGPDDDISEVDSTIVDLLTGEPKRRSELEETVQRMILVLAREYRFPLESIGRDIPLRLEREGRRRTVKASLVVFQPGQPHQPQYAIRVIIVRPPATKPDNATAGTVLLETILDALDNCDLGLWTNGRDVSYLHKIKRPVQNAYEELVDFPGSGESLDDLNIPDRRVARIAIADDLRQTVLRCHDYLYGNQAMTADRAFAEMVKVIFAKVMDERMLRASTSYRRQFWVGLTERNTVEGQTAISQRVRSLFDQLKRDRDFTDVFRTGDEIELNPRPLAWIAGELSRYNLLDAEVDVKGMAYEAIVATTMKQARGQFFTPRNIVEAMVHILAPQPGQKVLDPACGSGRFLVACLDRFRLLKAAEILGDADANSPELRHVANSAEVAAQAAAYAEACLYGIDVDPQLVRAAKMNMILNNDGHGNIYEANSLELTRTQAADRDSIGAGALAFDTFDVVLTNPPFGTKIPIDNPTVLSAMDLGHRRRRSDDGTWLTTGELMSKMPPEILFIERCMQWLKTGGRMAIVVPDGILGNPDNEHIREWILSHARVLASIDLPVEAFQPQVGVQASLLFLEKRATADINLGIEDSYSVFMAIAEHVGHDRRGVPIYRRDAYGYDIYEDHIERFDVLRDGKPRIEERGIRRLVPADDLPRLADAYSNWRDASVRDRDG